MEEENIKEIYQIQKYDEQILTMLQYNEGCSELGGFCENNQSMFFADETTIVLYNIDSKTISNIINCEHQILSIVSSLTFLIIILEDKHYFLLYNCLTKEKIKIDVQKCVKKISNVIEYNDTIHFVYLTNPFLIEGISIKTDTYAFNIMDCSLETFKRFPQNDFSVQSNNSNQSTKTIPLNEVKRDNDNLNNLNNMNNFNNNNQNENQFRQSNTLILSNDYNQLSQTMELENQYHTTSEIKEPIYRISEISEHNDQMPYALMSFEGKKPYTMAYYLIPNDVTYLNISEKYVTLATQQGYFLQYNFQTKNEVMSTPLLITQKNYQIVGSQVYNNHVMVIAQHQTIDDIDLYIIKYNIVNDEMEDLEIEHISQHRFVLIDMVNNQNEEMYFMLMTHDSRFTCIETFLYSLNGVKISSSRSSFNYDDKLLASKYHRYSIG